MRDEAAARHDGGDVEWRRSQVLDLVAAWDSANKGQRTQLLGALFESIEAEALPQRGVRLVAVPRGAWRIQLLVLERETGVSRGSTNVTGTVEFAYRLGAAD